PPHRATQREPAMIYTQTIRNTWSETIEDKLRELECLLGQGLIAIKQGQRLEAVEDLNAAFGVLEDVRVVLETPTRAVEK
ncbi:MAG: hypothetical protein ACREUQ_07225, partial [Burkholderiales bacterium]